MLLIKESVTSLKETHYIGYPTFKLPACTKSIL